MSITPNFNENEFNFNKVDEREILMITEIKGIPVTLLINNSPLKKYHTLVVPELKSNNPQVMTLNCLEVALEIMKSTDDRTIRLGYNSPGALASVNHLHIHLISLQNQLYVEDVELKNVVSNLFKIDDPKYSVQGYCLISKDPKSDAKKLNKLIQYCCEKTIPHNFFFTKSKTPGETRAFFFVRTVGNFGVDKMLASYLQIGFCELAGYIPIGDEKLYESIDESYIVNRFKQEIEEVCTSVEKDFAELLKNFE